MSHSPRCIPPTASLETVLLPLPRQQMFMQLGANLAWTNLGVAFGRGHALVIASALPLVVMMRVRYGSASTAEPGTDVVVVPLPTTREFVRFLPAQDVQGVDVFGDTTGGTTGALGVFYWVEDVSTLDVGHK